MNGRAFKLGTFAKPDGKPFAAIVVDDTAIHLAQAHEAYRGSGRPALSTAASSPGLNIQDLLADWDKNFAVLQEMVAFLDKEGAKPSAAPVTSLTALPPIARPGKMFYAAQNFQEHVDEMIRAGMSPKDRPEIHRREIVHRAVSVPQGAELPRRRQRRYRNPERREEGRLGGRDRAARSQRVASASRPSARSITSRAWMTTNDVSARDLQIRTDRPGLRSDWLNGKSHDKFAPMGPFLVPRAFVKDHMNLFIRLTVNGEVKQNGNTSQFIFTPEEQIEYASNILTSRPATSSAAAPAAASARAPTPSSTPAM